MEEKKKSFTELMEERQQKRRDAFAKGKSTLFSEATPKEVKDIPESGNLKAKSLNMPEIEPGQIEHQTSGDVWRKKINRELAGRKAERLAQDAALEAGEALDYRALRRAAAKSLRRGLKSVPAIGGIAAAIQSGDASAAVPMLGEADSVGMSPEDENIMLAEAQARKDYSQSDAAKARKQAILDRRLRGEQ